MDINSCTWAVDKSGMWRITNGYGYFYYNWKGYDIMLDAKAGIHLSVFGHGKLPNYDDLKAARYRFCPGDVYMAEIFPPQTEFINISKYCR